MAITEDPRTELIREQLTLVEASRDHPCPRCRRNGIVSYVDLIRGLVSLYCQCSMAWTVPAAGVRPNRARIRTPRRRSGFDRLAAFDAARRAGAGDETSADEPELDLDLDPDLDLDLDLDPDLEAGSAPGGDIAREICAGPREPDEGS
ncbi:MAG: hypothetical protein ACK5RL_09220 [Acidimicrobiales bacterium]